MNNVIKMNKEKLKEAKVKIKKLEKEKRSKKYSSVNEMFKDMNIDIDK